MKQGLKSVFFLLIVAAIGSLVMAWFGSSSRWINTAGVLTELSGITQLAISGFFQSILSIYSDEKEYPFGPPSYITRHIIDNPDTPRRSAIRSAIYFNTSTGAVLVVIGLLLQLLASWVPH